MEPRLVLRPVRQARHQVDNYVPEVHSVGTYLMPHGHVIIEDWPAGLKHRVADHIDRAHEKVPVGEW